MHINLEKKNSNILFVWYSTIGIKYAHKIYWHHCSGWDAQCNTRLKFFFFFYSLWLFRLIFHDRFLRRKYQYNYKLSVHWKMYLCSSNPSGFWTESDNGNSNKWKCNLNWGAHRCHDACVHVNRLIHREISWPYLN